MNPKRERTREIPWHFESLVEDRGFELRRFFSMDAAYLDGRLCLAVATRAKDPWSGLLICTDHGHHPSLQAELPALAPHAILGKWLYLTQTHPELEAIVGRLVMLVHDRDPRIGIAPKATKAKVSTKLPLGLVPWAEKKPKKRR